MVIFMATILKIKLFLNRLPTMVTMAELRLEINYIELHDYGTHITAINDIEGERYDNSANSDIVKNYNKLYTINRLMSYKKGLLNKNNYLRNLKNK